MPVMSLRAPDRPVERSAETDVAAGSWLGRVLRAPIAGRTWREVGYTMFTAPLAVLGAGYVALALYGGTLVSLTVIGLPIVVLLLTGARALGALHRLLVRALLGVSVAEPGAPPRATGLIGWVRTGLRDVVAWRCVAFLLLQLPVMILAAAVLVFWFQGALALVSPVLWQVDLDRPFPGPFDTWPWPLLGPPIGIAALLVGPWGLRLVLRLDTLLIDWLLGPSEITERVRTLERTRAIAVDDAATTVRRIERDLHDGAQARLVSIGMTLTLLRETLKQPELDRAQLTELTDKAQQSAKAAIAELRTLVRGVHPPALNAGLEQALATLAAQAAVPVRLRVNLGVNLGVNPATRPSPAIESIVYFCAAELLTNIARHSGATTASVEVTRAGSRLLLKVIDNGHGGAQIGVGSGLAGLAARTATVDGSLTVSSPPGGPTIITVDLPARG
jgi:signal transduction histidine kinase